MSVALQGLILEARVLAPLASWEPVGSRLESLVDAARAQGPISEVEIVKLRAWARRWTILPEPIRAFYLRHLEDEAPTARVVLWRVLHAERPEDWQIGALRRLWEADNGCIPLRDLAPIIR